MLRTGAITEILLLCTKHRSSVQQYKFYRILLPTIDAFSVH